MKQTILDYQARGFNVITAFGDVAFEHRTDWMRNKLHITLTICAANSYVPRAENAIRFVKERLKSIQYEIPIKKYPKKLTIEMTKRATVLINSFRRKSGLHSVMSPTHIICGKKFKTPLCKMGELVLAYDLLSNKKTSKIRAFYALVIGPNDGGTGHPVFKLSIKKMIITPRCKPIPMPDDVIEVINQMGEDDGSLDGIVSRNILKESTIDDMHGDVDSYDTGQRMAVRKTRRILCTMMPLMMIKSTI